MQQKDLAKAREAKGLTQDEASKKIGITQSGLSRYECGNRTATQDKLDKLRSLYSIDDD